MAEITTTNNWKEGRSFSRPARLRTSIDMTPMVDLGFLLITFFIFTATMSQPSTLSLVMPADKGEPTPIKQSGALTLIPTEDRRFLYYEGFPTAAGLRTASLQELRGVIANKKRRTPEKDFVVTIKPDRSSSYASVVDLLDEMTIGEVARYALVDLSPEEERLMRERGH
jgi:biopolymer transport protein ExbD